ncbi:MAG: methyltransferase type 11 [Candidatus Peregrinibacteria bacterium GW2011_GWF2_38_29]|nr:MAG: methyltransferase type 11 [Candidatus Peregrinibacteria bacterium GW2011_GWF2_38_29]HBB03170.1 hypothetical protein [Candidatus Peregrinibacteria bacterium]
MSYKSKLRSKLYAPEEGYDLYAEEYATAKSYQSLDEFEEGVLMEMVNGLGDSGFLKGKNVLDAGCGSGRIIGKLKNLEANITAIDISEKMIEIVRKKNSGVEVVKGDVRKMPFESGKFDIVIAPFVIVHMKKLDAFFEECYRVLKTGGTFIFTNVNQRKAPKLKIKHHGEICIESYYHIPEQVREAVNNAFFVIEEEKFVYNGEVWINQIIKARK